MAVAVIGGALVGITQDAIGLANFLELGFRFRIPLILVRVVLHRKLAIGGFQLFFVCVARNAEYFIIVTFCHDLLPSSRIPCRAQSCGAK